MRRHLTRSEEVFELEESVLTAPPIDEDEYLVGMYVRLPLAMKKALLDQSRAEGVSMSSLVRKALQRDQSADD